MLRVFVQLDGELVGMWLAPVQPRSATCGREVMVPCSMLSRLGGLYLLAVQSGAREASTDREKLLDFRGLLCTSEEKNIKHIARLPRLIITTHSYFLSKLVGKPNRVNCPDWLGIDR